MFRFLQILKKQEVLDDSYDENNYTSKRLWAKSRDGLRIPISIVYHKKTKLNPKTTINIAKPGKSENHHVSGNIEAPLATIVPRSGVGACAPNPKKLRDEPTRITKPKSKVIFVNNDGRQLGKISLNIIKPL